MIRLFYYNKPDPNSMKGIHIQFEGINRFIDSFLLNITSQAAECYLLNLEKITLETFTILQIALGNAVNDIPEEVRSTFEKTTSKFKEYFKHKPKFEADKQEYYTQDFDEVQHFLDNRPLLKLSNQSERGQLYKFLTENEEKEKNNRIQLDNRPKYSYASPKITLEQLQRPIPSNSKPTFKQRSQQTYSSDFVVKPECIYPSLEKIDHSEQETQTELTVNLIQDIIQQYTQQLIQDKENCSIEPNFRELLASLQTKTSQALKYAIKKKFGEGVSEIEEAQRRQFLESIIANKEGLFAGDPCNLGIIPQKKEKKKKEKNTKKPVKRSSEMLKVPEVVTQGRKSAKDLLKKIETNKSIPQSGKSIKSIDANCSSQIVSQDRRTSISKFAFGNTKADKTRISKPSQFNGKVDSQAQYPAISESPETFHAAAEEAMPQTNDRQQSSQLKGSFDLKQQSKPPVERQQSSEVKQSNSKRQFEQEITNLSGVQRQKELQINTNDNPGQSQGKQNLIEKSEKQKKEANTQEKETHDQLQQSVEKQCWEVSKQVPQKGQESVVPSQLLKQQRNILPAIEKSSKHSSLPHHEKNIQSIGQLFNHKEERHLLKDKFNQTYNSHLSLYQRENGVSEWYSPKSTKVSLYNPQGLTEKYKLPVVNRESKPFGEVNQGSNSDYKALMEKQGERIWRQIKENASSKKQKNIEWFKLIKNIKQYQKHHVTVCGANCVHLSKFYQFLKRHNLSMYTNRKQLSLHKKNIEMNMTLE